MVSSYEIIEQIFRIKPRKSCKTDVSNEFHKLFIDRLATVFMELREFSAVWLFISKLKELIEIQWVGGNSALATLSNIKL